MARNSACRRRICEVPGLRCFRQSFRRHSPRRRDIWLPSISFISALLEVLVLAAVGYWLFERTLNRDRCERAEHVAGTLTDGLGTLAIALWFAYRFPSDWVPVPNGAIWVTGIWAAMATAAYGCGVADEAPRFCGLGCGAGRGCRDARDFLRSGSQHTRGILEWLTVSCRAGRSGDCWRRFLLLSSCAMSELWAGDWIELLKEFVVIFGARSSGSFLLRLA